MDRLNFGMSAIEHDSPIERNNNGPEYWTLGTISPI